MAKVLVADDVADIVRLLSFTLTSQGHEVSVAYSGREALERAFAERPDAILLDVTMPDMDGIEVCKRIRANPELRTTPVILVTARNHDEDFVIGLAAGADDYVTKPFIPEVLAARLRGAIRIRQAHDEITRMNEQLRAEIADRKRAEDKLREAQKMEAVGLLAGGVAHEFNNLLQAIAGYSSCALEGLSPPDQRYSDLQQVLKATERAATLTRELLGLSRRSMLQPMNFDPNMVVADLVKMLRSVIGEHIALHTVLGKDVGTVFSDPSELHQVLLNLCLNARDAMPEGGYLLLQTESVELNQSSTEMEIAAEPGRYVAFTVTDTGAGMTPEVRQRIFEPFFTTKEVGKGTGLGLSMVYGTVQQHKGTMRVASEPGKGTTFTIYLPAGGDMMKTEQSVHERKVSLFGTETILLAEDEPIVQRLSTRFLRQAGYTVLTASDGEEALRLFEQNKEQISLVILDAIMPKLTGHRVYRRLKELCPEIKVIFCTGYDSETAQSSFIAEERLRLIEKPFDEDTLQRAVREVLDEDTHPKAAMDPVLAEVALQALDRLLKK